MLIQRLVGMELLRSINLRGLGSPVVVENNAVADEKQFVVHNTADVDTASI